jgi:hypothetical protein
MFVLVRVRAQTDPRPERESFLWPFPQSMGHCLARQQNREISRNFLWAVLGSNQ